jgi:hypothetical protein
MASRMDTPVQLGRALSEFDAFMEGKVLTQKVKSKK